MKSPKKLLNSPTKFRKELRKKAKDRGIFDLELKLANIEENLEYDKIRREFIDDPYKKTKEGEYVFWVGEYGGNENLLEHFSIEEISQLIDIPVIRKGDQHINIHKNPNLGQITILPDTNVWIQPSSLRNLNNDPSYNVDLLTIVREECAKAPSGKKGISRYQSVPQELLLGQKSIEKRLENYSDSYVTEVKTLYECIWDYFQPIIKDLEYHLKANPNLSDIEIAKKVVKHDYELRLYKKQVEKLKEGNKWNLVADRLLVAASYVLNLADCENVTVVVSEDGDLDTVSKLMHDEIFPKYMARTTYEILQKESLDTALGITSEQDLIDSAKEHLQASETLWESETNSKHCAGIIYNPKTNEFSFSTLPKAYVHYIMNNEAYRMGKQQMIVTASTHNIKPEEALDKLMSLPVVDSEEDFEKMERVDTIPKSYLDVVRNLPPNGEFRSYP